MRSTSRTFLQGFITFIICFVATADGHKPQTLAPLNRRPLQEKNPSLKGIDIFLNKESYTSTCQSTPVAKKSIGENLCRLALSTGAHCVDDDDLKSISFDGIGTIAKEQLKILIPSEYLEAKKKQDECKRKTPTQPTKKKEEPRVAVASPELSHTGMDVPLVADSALIVFDIDCDKIKDITPVELAPVEPDGTTRCDIDVYLQKRVGKSAGNRGESAQISAQLSGIIGSKFIFYVPSPQGYAIVGGDSGGPIFNKSGQLICPISGSQYELLRMTGQLKCKPDGTREARLDAFTVECDKKAISRMQKHLKELKLND